MSAETKAALDEALRAHLADEMPEHPLLADYYCVAASVGAAQDTTGYLHIWSDNGSHVHLGLLTIGRLRLETNYATGDGWDQAE